MHVRVQLKLQIMECHAQNAKSAYIKKKQHPNDFWEERIISDSTEKYF